MARRRRKSSKSCPTTWRGHKVYRTKRGSCYVKLRCGGGQTMSRFVRKR